MSPDLQIVAITTKNEHKAHHSCKPCHEDEPVRCYIWYGIHIYRFRAGSCILYKIGNLEKMVFVFFSTCIKPQWYEENGEEYNATEQFLFKISLWVIISIQHWEILFSDLNPLNVLMHMWSCVLICSKY